MEANEGTLLVKIGYKDYKSLYLDWVNNYLTTDGFAAHHNILEAEAAVLIDNACYLYGRQS